MALSNKDRASFIKTTLKLAVPLTIQSVFFSSKSLTDVLMLGQLSDESVAAVGVVARVFMIATFIIYATANAGGTLIAQYFGARSNLRINQAFQATMLVTVGFSLPVVAVFLLWPQWIVGVATVDQAVISQGGDYLKIVAVQLACVAYVSCFAAALRSIHLANVATLYSVLGVIVNIVLNYVLIFGHFGAPALGIKGAALATVIASIVEVVALTVHVKAKGAVLQLFGRSLLQFNEIRSVVKLAWPVALNMTTYSVGLFAYVVIFGNISTEALATISLLTPIESIATSLLLALASAVAVVIGNAIGEGRGSEHVYQLGRLATLVSIASAIVVTLLMLALEPLVLGWLHGFSQQAESMASIAYKIVAVGVVVRALPIVLIIGVLRAGGDNRYCLYQDLISQWGIGVPVVALLGIVLGLPLPIVFASLFLEELVKVFGSLHRLRSRKWVNNFVGAPA
ncbi:MATE family efflux transporter [Exilibacterium tricleocarpae]|nr:MATE family efflux transporter [Exilibacterium tricleocarpae]